MMPIDGCGGSAGVAHGGGGGQCRVDDVGWPTEGNGEPSTGGGGGKSADLSSTVTKRVQAEMYAR